MDHVHFPYRSDSHLALLHVVAESGAWEKHGLAVNYDYKISAADAHRDVPTHDVEFVGGNHVSTYGRRARGDSWVYLGQTVNFTNFKLVVKPDSGIAQVADLKQKIVGSKGMHPGLNDWLYLKQRGLDVDKDQVDLRKLTPRNLPGSNRNKDDDFGLWEAVRDGHVDAAFLTPPSTLFAERAGLKVIDIDPLPMIWFTTISSSLSFVERHPDLVERFLKAMMEGIAFFKTQPQKTMEILLRRYTNEGQLDAETVGLLYRELAQILEPKLYPSLQAMANVYEEGVRQDKDALRVNPVSLWNFHHIRKLDDEGFAASLYGSQGVPVAVPA
jgi:ABC-type nitrate/sulfonate/bicarbonate transport system substrate-binding protein